MGYDTAVFSTVSILGDGCHAERHRLHECNALEFPACLNISAWSAGRNHALGSFVRRHDIKFKDLVNYLAAAHMFKSRPVVLRCHEMRMVGKFEV